jgi:hypothetical protein
LLVVHEVLADEAIDYARRISCVSAFVGQLACGCRVRAPDPDRGRAPRVVAVVLLEVLRLPP